MDPMTLLQQAAEADEAVAEIDRQIVHIRRACEVAVAEKMATAEPLRAFAESTRRLLESMGHSAPSPTPPADDGGRDPNPRGVEAVIRILQERPGEPRTASQVADLIAERGWVDLKSEGNLLNATRTNLIRAVSKNPNISRPGHGKYVFLPVASADPPAEPEPF